MIETIISIIALGAAIVIPMFQYFVTIGGMQANIKHLESDIGEIKNICTKVAMLETKIEPFWNLIDEQLPMMLKGKSGRIDILLTKYIHKNPSLADNERWELIDLLVDKFNESNDVGKQLAIGLMIEKLKIEDKLGEEH